MYTHPRIISTLATGLVLTIGYSFSANAQQKKPERQVQIKIIENGKVKTDTSYTVDHDFDQKDMDALINEPGGDKEISYEYNINTDFGPDIERNFKFKEEYDSIVAYKDGKPQKMMNPAFQDDFDMPAPPPFPGLNHHEKRFYFHDTDDQDSSASNVEKHVIIRKHGAPGEKRMIVDNEEDGDFETIENSDNVVIKRKVSPGHQQIIVEKSNPNVTIKKDKRGKIEITIEDKNSDKKEKK